MSQKNNNKSAPKSSSVEVQVDLATQKRAELWGIGLNLGLISKKHPYDPQYRNVFSKNELIDFIENFNDGNDSEKKQLRAVFTKKIESIDSDDEVEEPPKTKSKGIKVHVDDDAPVPKAKASKPKPTVESKPKDEEIVQRKPFVKKTASPSKTPHVEKKVFHESELMKLFNEAKKAGLVDSHFEFLPYFYSFITPDEFAVLLEKYLRTSSENKKTMVATFKRELKQFMASNAYANKLLYVHETYEELISKANQIGLLFGVEFDKIMKKIVSLPELAAFVVAAMASPEAIRKHMSKVLTERYEKGLKVPDETELTFDAFYKHGRSIGFFVDWIEDYKEQLRKFITVRDLRNLFKTIQYLSGEDERLRKKRFYTIFLYYLNTKSEKEITLDADFMKESEIPSSPKKEQKKKSEPKKSELKKIDVESDEESESDEVPVKKVNKTDKKIKPTQEDAE